MAAMTLDEFFNMAQLGGQLKACHDIFEIMSKDELSTDEITNQLAAYQSETFKNFQHAQLKFKMADSKVRMDEDSIETL